MTFISAARWALVHSAEALALATATVSLGASTVAGLTAAVSTIASMVSLTAAGSVTYVLYQSHKEDVRTNVNVAPPLL